MSPKDLRTLVTGSALVMAIVGTGKGVPAFRAWETARLSAAAEVRLQLDDAYGGATELRVLRDSARVRAARLDSVSVHLLSAQSADAAAGALASLVQTLAQAQGLDVLTLTLNPDTVVHAGLARVTVRLTAQGDVAGLMDFLLEVETHDTLLVVRDLSVTQSEPMAPSSTPDALRLDVGVQTIARILGPAAPRGEPR